MKNVSLATFALIAALVAAANAESPSLFKNGEFLTGYNYWASDSGIYMWRRWNAATVEKDVADLARNGISLMRVFPLWPDFLSLVRLTGVSGERTVDF